MIVIPNNVINVKTFIKPVISNITFRHSKWSNFITWPILFCPVQNWFEEAGNENCNNNDQNIKTYREMLMETDKKVTGTM